MFVTSHETVRKHFRKPSGNSSMAQLSLHLADGASSYGIAAVLSHVMTDGTEPPCFLQSFNAVMKNSEKDAQFISHRMASFIWSYITTTILPSVLLLGCLLHTGWDQLRPDTAAVVYQKHWRWKQHTQHRRSQDFQIGQDVLVGSLNISGEVEQWHTVEKTHWPHSHQGPIKAFSREGKVKEYEHHDSSFQEERQVGQEWQGFCRNRRQLPNCTNWCTRTTNLPSTSLRKNSAQRCQPRRSLRQHAIPRGPESPQNVTDPDWLFQDGKDVVY